MRTQPAALLAIDHEELVIRRGRRSGLYSAIAVHSTTLGPALGGCRMWSYADSMEGARDALRLSRAMTLKAAAAGLDLGGGKGVIVLPPGAAPPRGAARRDVLLDFADAVNALDGSYVTAEDVGTSARDMVTIAEVTRWVSGLPVVHGGSGDPSSFTALGVEVAIRACLRERLGSPEPAGRRVAVVGCGRVGERLARRLAAGGAQLLLADVDASKRALVAELAGASWVAPDAAVLADVDVLAPCALGGVVHDVNVDRLRAAIVCGSANNQLADDRLAERLAARGVLYAPDFIVNAGGLINVSAELTPGGWDEATAHERVSRIGPLIDAILREARRRDVTPLAAAVELARGRLEASGAALKISPTAPRAETPPRPESDRTEIPQPVRRGDRHGDPGGPPALPATGAGSG